MILVGKSKGTRRSSQDPPIGGPEPFYRIPKEIAGDTEDLTKPQCIFSWCFSNRFIFSASVRAPRVSVRVRDNALNNETLCSIGIRPRHN